MAALEKQIQEGQKSLADRGLTADVVLDPKTGQVRSFRLEHLKKP
jgi:hypothetical protein